MSDFLRIVSRTFNNFNGEIVTKDSFPEPCKYCNRSSRRLLGGNFVKVLCDSCNDESFIGISNIKVDVE